MSLRRRITVCADDFALDTAVSSAVLELASNGCISAVSCLTDAPLWKDAGAEMLRHRDSVLMGLHFNLTQGFGRSRATLARTILAAVTRRLDPVVIAAELERQIGRFTAVAGHLPDFIDGHEHVHTFPVVADVVRRMAEELGPGAPIPIRSVSDLFGPTDAPFKRAVIRALAALGGGETASVRQNRLNTGFAGDYSLRARADFAGLFQAWLETAPNRALIMCHPRRDTADEVASAGGQEFRFLGSRAFTSLRDWHSIRFLRRDELVEGVFSQSTSNELHRAGVDRPVEPIGTGEKLCSGQSQL